jgi:YHS domain-containing protein
VKTNGGRLAVAALSGFLLVVLIRGLTGCSSGETADAEPPVPGATDEVAVVTDETAEQLPEGVVDLDNTLCPVMGLQVMEGEYVDWEGYRVHFCCSGCDEAFLSDPEHYLGVLAEDPSVAGILESGAGD